MSATLTSSMQQRSQQPRPTRTPPPPPTTYQPRPSSQSTIVPPRPTHQSRPSIQSTMHWLSRSTTQNSSSTPYSPSKPVKVSEPKLVRSIDILSPTRSGALGSGATVVRTPDEALRETGVRMTFEKDLSSRTSQEKERKDKDRTPKLRHTHKGSVSKHDGPISPPTSPPLPPLPLPADDEETLLESRSSGSKTPPPSRTPPLTATPLQRSPSKRSSMKVPRAISITNSNMDEPPTVPPLPPHIAASTQPPPFSPILISEPPPSILDASKVIVSLETCTTTFKTTLATINSRSSHLSGYLSALFSDTKSVSSSIYSTESDDVELYRDHLTSQGLVPTTSNVHIFLDRPSAPYAHILTYLRTPVVEGQPEVLPRALQLQLGASGSSSVSSVSSSASQSSNTRLEALIEVRDEAAYLNLEGLHKLCTDEMRHRYGPRLHHRGHSSSSVASIHSLHASVYSLHTLIERVETDLRTSGISTYTPPPAHSDGLGQHHSNGNLNSTGSMGAPAAGVPMSAPVGPSSSAISIRRSKQQQQDGTTSRSPPTPQSWEGPLPEQRSQSRQSQQSRSNHPPPAGWI